ncbi:hypothetical protein [Myceligenerans salitolerans]|uniref:Lipoprotein n=1 Tax=Myceligenerans salitolerans TaxID=1230528 RepID=A0ABS3ICS8_9MICO|nr:hypothetical protein [Myceligenerans salitolerans]MBO0610826.1 hypothetical protein [Myceligenerans salitolerans]
MRITRKIAALLTAGVATVTLTACQSGAGTSEPAAAGDNAIETATSEAAGGGYTALSVSDFVERSTAAQAAMSTMRYTATFSGPAAEAQGMADAGMQGAMATGETAADTAMQMTMDIEGATFDMIMVGGDFYMNMGPLTQDKYLHVTGEDSSRAELDAMMQQLDQANIAGQTRAMEGAVSEVTEVGTETVNGVETHHYAVTVDLAKAKDLAALGIDEAMAREMGTMEVEYFLDEEDVPHRVVTTMAEGEQDLVVTVDITDQGEPVDIAAPAAGQIIDASEMGM